MTLSPGSAPPRWATDRDPAAPTYGPAVARVAELLGRPFLPWQRLVADVTGEQLPDGRMRFPTVVLLVPRRAGKTVLTFATLMQRSLTRAGARCWYTAQSGGDAGKTLRDEWLPLVEAGPLDAHVRKRLQNGAEQLRIPSTGARIGIFPPTRTGLHGQDADVVVVDEGWAFPAAHGAVLDAAIGPAQATRTGRQRFVVSAGGDVGSTWLLHLRALGRDAVAAGSCTRDGLAYFEWSADEDVDDLDDPATWARTHPAIGHTIDVEALRSDYATMDRAGFYRGYLNVFTETLAVAAVDPAAWRACRDPEAAAAGRLALAYDVAVDGSWSSIAVASRRPDGVVVVELAKYLPGTADVADEVARMRAAHRASVHAPPDGPVTAVTAELRRRGVDVDELPAGRYATACAELLADVRDGRVAHRGQRPLDLAAAGAAQRQLGDGWAWTRRRSAVDIGPLVAATVAAAAARGVARGTAPLIRLPA